MAKQTILKRDRTRASGFRGSLNAQDYKNQHTPLRLRVRTAMLAVQSVTGDAAMAEFAERWPGEVERLRQMAEDAQAILEALAKEKE